MSESALLEMDEPVPTLSRVRGGEFPDRNPHPVLCCDAEGDVLYANPSAQRLVETIGGSSLSDLLPEDHAVRVRRCLGREIVSDASVVRDRAILRWTYRAVAPDRAHVYGILVERASDHGAGTSPSPSATALDHLPWGVLGLDAGLGVTFENRAARVLLDTATSLHREGNRLRTRAPEDDAALGEAIERALGHPGTRPGRVPLRIRRADGETPLDLLLVPLSRRSDASGAAVLLYVFASEAPKGPSEALLAELYGLTPAESRVAERLAAGMDLPECASDLGISIGTVRVHLRSIFRKTGVHRQAGLVRLLLAGPASIIPDTGE